jgi:Ca-activated chloride channel family protein
MHTMPQLTNPAFLLLLPSLPLLGWWWLRRRRSAFNYSDVRILKGLPGGDAGLFRWGAAGLRVTGLILLILALCGPRWPDERTRITTEGIAIAMVTDVSGSMSESDFDWHRATVSRLDAAKRALGLFVAGGQAPDGRTFEGRPDDLICLVTFATRPQTACPLTLSHSVLLHLLEAERPRTLPTESETNIGDAIAWAVQRLESAGTRRKVLVLLTDGEHNVPPPALTPRQAAQIAAGLKIPIYAILAGGRAGGEEGEKRVDPAQTLQAVAQITGGRSFRADDSNTLLGVCAEIDRLERQDIHSFYYRRYYQAYGWFGLAALAVLALGQALEKTWWRIVP